MTTGRLILYFYTGRMATRNQMYTVHYLCHTVSLLLYHPTNLTRRQVRGSDYRKTHIIFLHRKNGYKEPNVHCTLSMSHSFPPSLPPHQLRQEDKWEVVTTGRLILYFYTGRMATRNQMYTVHYLCRNISWVPPSLPLTCPTKLDKKDKWHR